MKTAFLGLGVMGYHMAGYLQKGGHETTVYNRTSAKAVAWTEEFGGSMAETPAEAAKGADIVFACVGNDDDLRAVVLGENGAFEGMTPNTIFVDNTTASAEVARELYAAGKERGIAFIDAPVSGGEAGAQQGILTVMCGGDEDAFATAQPVIDCFARAVTLLGPSGSGQLTKMVNQVCFVSTVQGLSEGLNFAVRAGLDAKKVLEVISKGAAQSWQMDNRGTTMVDDEFDFGFAVDWVRKDLGIVLSEADNNGSQMPMTALIDQFYKEVQAMGGGRWDTSSLIKRLRQNDEKP
ncbi:NAD(P)-dependent oxidoreductase [Magnetovibrio sp. PR-2]|uniref:NAD(P)-dependent oxidoreductase n=1 Tax=Magnetovibrio sp. PR-2 TaxID=3120356 RepID=UPI002FCDE58E